MELKPKLRVVYLFVLDADFTEICAIIGLQKLDLCILGLWNTYFDHFLLTFSFGNPYLIGFEGGFVAGKIEHPVTTPNPFFGTGKKI